MEALGGVAWWQADLETMAVAYGEALAIWEELGDTREIANALYNDSFRYAVTASRGEADPDGIGFAQMSRARDLAAAAADERGRANALWGIGNWMYFHDTDDRGAAQFREALEIFSRIGERTMEAWSLHMLSTALIRAGVLDEARDRIRVATQLFHRFGDVAGLALALDDFASIAVADDDLPRAAGLWGAARALSSAGGVRLADFVDEQYEAFGRPTARGAGSDAELQQYVDEGRSMTLDESVAYALESDIDSLAPHDHAGAVR